MILPSIIITFIGFLGFVIPSDSGEKISMGVASLLSMTVFLQNVADSLPPNSDSVPLIALYYFYSMLFVSLAILCTIITLNIHKRGDTCNKPVPKSIQKILFTWIGPILIGNLNDDNNNETIIQKNTNEKMENIELNINSNLNINIDLNEFIKSKENLSSTTADFVYKYQWSYLSKLIDLMFFYVFIFLKFLLLFIIYSRIPDFRL